MSGSKIREGSSIEQFELIREDSNDDTTALLNMESNTDMSSVAPPYATLPPQIASEALSTSISTPNNNNSLSTTTPIITTTPTTAAAMVTSLPKSATTSNQHTIEEVAINVAEDEQEEEKEKITNPSNRLASSKLSSVSNTHEPISTLLQDEAGPPATSGNIESNEKSINDPLVRI